tara:strand:- start:4834 stop:8691 length:3858 start_codon:yes stop_codon:yes gene_type:complete
MAEEEQKTDTIPYEELQQIQNPENKRVVDAMFYTVQNLNPDEKIEYDPKKIIDRFLNEQRYFDVNLGSTIGQAAKIKNFSDIDKKLYQIARDGAAKLPTIFEEGSAPVGTAVKDYVLAGISDPTNLASILASGFTFGFGGAAGIAAKEAAKAGVKQTLKEGLKSQVAKAKLLAPVIAVEGGTAAIGGATQNYIKQDLEIDLDERTNIDPLQVFTQGAIEGVASPLAGIIGGYALKGAGKAVSGTVKAGMNTASKIDALANIKTKTDDITNVFERYFLPSFGLKESTVLKAEQNLGMPTELKGLGQKLTEKLDNAIVKDFSDMPREEVNSLFNKAYEEGINSEAIKTIKAKSPESGEVLDAFLSKGGLRDRSIHYGITSALDDRYKGIFTKNENYVKNVPEALASRKRLENYSSFKKQNPNIIKDLKRDILASPQLAYWRDEAEQIVTGIGTENKSFRSDLSESVIDKKVEDIAKKLYSPNMSRAKQTGSLEAIKTEQQLPTSVKKVIGYNNRPALRIGETVNALVDFATKANAVDIVFKDTQARGLSTVAKDAAEAAEKLGVDKVMRLSGAIAKDGVTQTKLDDTVTQIPYAIKLTKEGKEQNIPILDSKFKDVWVTADEGKKLKTLFQYQRGDVLGESIGANTALAKNISGIQGSLKAGKTLYNPLAIARNAISGMGYVMSSGNLKGLMELPNYFNKLDVGSKDKLIQEFIADGFLDSDVRMNQVMRRLGDVGGQDKYFKELLRTSGLSIADVGSLKPGKKVAEKLQKAFVAGDNVAKFLTYISEDKSLNKIFDDFTPQQKKVQLKQLSDTFGIANPKKEDYVRIYRNRNTKNLTPVYSRVPAVLEMMRRVPVIGNFTAYPTERLRNTYNLFRTAGDEIRIGVETGNNALRNRGLSRFVQFQAAKAAPYTAAYVGTALYNKEDVEEIYDKLRNQLPPWAKDNAILFLGKDKKGKDQFVDLTYLEPDSHLLSLVMPTILKASRGEDVSKDLDDAVKEAAEKLFEPYISPTLFTELSEPLVSGIFKGVKGDYEGSANDLSRGARQMAKAAMPGYAKMAMDITVGDTNLANLVMSDESFSELKNTMYAVPYKPLDEEMSVVDSLFKRGIIIPGLKLQTIDPVESTGFALATVNRSIASATRSFSSNLKRMIREPSYKIDVKELLENYDDILAQQFTAQQEVKKIYQDLVKAEGRNKAIKILRKSTIKQVLPSKRALQNIINSNRSVPRTLSTNNTYWREVILDLEKDGYKNVQPYMDYLRKELKKVENFYFDRDLAKEPPEIKIGSD